MTVDEYVQTLDVDFVRRMRNWAAEARGDGCGHVKAMNYGARPSSGYREASVPVMTGEASDTDRAVATLPLRYRQVVVRFWVDQGRSWTWHGQQRGVHHETVAIWVRTGHALLMQALAQRARRHMDRRAGMIALIRA